MCRLKKHSNLMETCLLQEKPFGTCYTVIVWSLVRIALEDTSGLQLALNHAAVWVRLPRLPGSLIIYYSERENL